MSDIYPVSDLKRGRSPTREGDDAAREQRRRQRKRKNRWGTDAPEDNTVAKLLNVETTIKAAMTPEQIEAYTLSVRIEEISSKLKLNDVVPRDGERSPSPPPEYDQQGKRLNTREVRYRQKLEDERHKLIAKAFQVIPNFKPPVDYRKPQKTQEKIYIPVNDYPEINFIGLIIGPRGNTLKNMEIDSGAKIAVRGKGSVKEGKGRTDVPYQHSMDDDLHCLITSDSEEKIQKAIGLINKIIETAASVPEGQNDLKRGQLRELASLNGTLRDDEAITCPVCGETGHKRYDCPHKKNFTNSLICRICGGQGHFARDCKERPNNFHNNNYNNNHGMITSGSNSTAADREYEQLMQELGTSTMTNRLALENGPGGASPSSGGAPWMKPSSGGPAPWASQGNDNSTSNQYNNNNNNNNYESRGGSGGYNNRPSYNNNNNYERRGGFNNNDRRGGYENNRGGFGGNDRQFNRYDNNNRDQDQNNREQYGGYRRDNNDNRRGGMNNYNDRRGGYNRSNYDGNNSSRSNNYNNSSNDYRKHDNNSGHGSSQHNSYGQDYSQQASSSLPSSYQSQSMPPAPPSGPSGGFPMPPGMPMMPSMPSGMNPNNGGNGIPGPPGMPPSFRPPPPPPSSYNPPPPSSYPPPPPPNY